MQFNELLKVLKATSRFLNQRNLCILSHYKEEKGHCSIRKAFPIYQLNDLGNFNLYSAKLRKSLPMSLLLSKGLNQFLYWWGNFVTVHEGCRQNFLNKIH